MRQPLSEMSVKMRKHGRLLRLSVAILSQSSKSARLSYSDPIIPPGWKPSQNVKPPPIFALQELPESLKNPPV